MTRIVFLDRETMGPGVTMRRPSFLHEWIEYDQTALHEVVERLDGAAIAVVNKVPLRREVIAQLPDLRFVAVTATGTDIVDLQACAERGIVVSNVRAYATTTVPEHTFMLILALRRSLLGYHEAVRAGRWQESGQFCFFDHPIRDLRGSRLGIIGEGALGSAVADIARGFGMKVLVSAHKGRSDMGPAFTPFETVLETSDVITLHCPLLPSTRNLIGAEEFARMRRRPLLINTSRGGLVDETALAEALRKGQISGAGFDVATQEPPPADHPLMQLVGLPNFILTPHVAWASLEARQVVADQTIANMESFHAGAPTNAVLAT